MASDKREDNYEFFKYFVRKYEPYSLDIFDNLTFDGKSRVGDKRYAATIGLKALLDAGFSEEEVNPWKNKDREDKNRTLKAGE